MRDLFDGMSLNCTSVKYTCNLLFSMRYVGEMKNCIYAKNPSKMNMRAVVQLHRRNNGDCLLPTRTWCQHQQ